ncbi:hypothetical protein [Streptomyces hypolithicus]
MSRTVSDPQPDEPAEPVEDGPPPSSYDDISHPVYFGVNGAVAVAAGLVVVLMAPWLRRTMHPVH